MRIRRMRWMMSVGFAGLLALAVGACGGDDPTATPTPRPAATPTPTAMMMMEEPTPTPTAMMMEEPTPTAMMMEEPTPTAMMMEEPTPTPAPVVDPGVTFEGKTIRIVANSSPGGGTDTQGRVMSAFMSRYIPGNPRVVFTNNPNKPLEYIYSATEAPKDGTYISWNSTPQLAFGFSENTRFIKRSTFEPIGSTIDPTRGWMLYDPVGNLGPSAANSCLWDYSGMSSTGGGKHEEFILADELSDIAEGNPTLLASVYASEQLEIPFTYLGFTTVDTNAVRTMWARGDINSTVRSSLWYRFPVENPDWIPSGRMRLMAGMGPGALRANAQTEPHCGDVREHLSADQTHVFNSLIGPTNYASKALWLPPGTPEDIAETLTAAFERALTMDEDLIQKYAGVAGEEPGWIGRAELKAATLENEQLFEGAKAIVDEQAARLLPKYFAQYVGG